MGGQVAIRSCAVSSAVEERGEEEDVQDNVCKPCLNGGAGRHKKSCSVGKRAASAMSEDGDVLEARIRL